MESVAFSEESRLCLGASYGRVLVRKRSGERLQPNCLQPRHTGPTFGIMARRVISHGGRGTHVVIPNTLIANLYVSLVIQPIVLPFMKIVLHSRGVSNRLTLTLTPLLKHNVLYRVLTCDLGLGDH
ncbi:HTH_Tnp_Tc3_2 domain-containing protein [Trichonephila clavipes]|nr:HTH_Tnp_Tc3_2 domain-containing protein [Trichonephila clavipes]